MPEAGSQQPKRPTLEPVLKDDQRAWPGGGRHPIGGSDAG